MGRDACDVAFMDRQGPTDLPEQLVTVNRTG